MTRIGSCIALLVSAVIVTGCGVPLQWRRVSLDAPTQGVRYVLKRPAYLASVRFDGRVPVLRVEQTLDGDPIVLEATSRTNPLADTRADITIAGDGSLSALSGGETDRSLEVFMAALDLAKTAVADAPLLQSISSERQQACTALGARIAQHIGAIRQPWLASAKSLDDRIAKEEIVLRAAIDKGDSSVPARLKGLAALRGEAERIQTMMEEDALPLGQDDFSVTLAPDAACGAKECPALLVQGGPDACVKVLLQLERTL